MGDGEGKGPEEEKEGNPPHLRSPPTFQPWCAYYRRTISLVTFAVIVVKCSHSRPYKTLKTVKF